MQFRSIDISPLVFGVRYMDEDIGLWPALHCLLPWSKMDDKILRPRKAYQSVQVPDFS
jgi:hypothetical protein